MRSALAASIWITLIGCSLAAASPLGAAPKAPKQEPEKYLPIHAVLSVRGTAIPDEFCTAHGFIVVWKGDHGAGRGHVIETDYLLPNYVFRVVVTPASPGCVSVSFDKGKG